MPKNALLIIDMQGEFLEKDSKLPGKIRMHIEKSKYDYVLFTKFKKTKNSPLVKKIRYKRARQKGRIVKELEIFTNRKNVFKKKTYSAFKSKRLVKFIKKNKIKKIDVCGIELDACILASGSDAFHLGIKFKILPDLTKMFSSKERIKQIKKVINKGLKSKKIK